MTADSSVAETKNSIAIVYGRLENQAKRLQHNREAHSIYAHGHDHPKNKAIARFICVSRPGQMCRAFSSLK